jgi:hypothetical protein
MAARWRGGVHDDFPFDHLGMDVIRQHRDDVVRSPHILKDRRRSRTRLAVLDAAAALMAEGGLAAVTIRLWAAGLTFLPMLSAPRGPSEAHRGW